MDDLTVAEAARETYAKIADAKDLHVAPLFEVFVGARSAVRAQ